MSSEDKGITVSSVSMPIIALSAMTALCYFAASVIVPLVTAVTLAFVLWPLVRLLKRIKVPHVPAVLIVMLLTILVVIALGMMIYGQVKDFTANVPGYWEKFQQLRAEWMAKYPVISDALLQQQGENIFNQLDIGKLASIPKYLFKGIGSALSFIGQAMLIFLLTLFALIEQKGLRNRLTAALGSERIGASSRILDEVSTKIASYIAIRAVTTIGLVVVITTGLLIGGVDYAYIWGPLAGVLNLVPYVGAYLGAVPPMIFVAVESGSFLPMLWVFIFFMAVQFVESNIITPKLLGDQLNISLLAQLIATIYWGWLWGAVGIVLAIPITAALKVICDEIEDLRPIGTLLSGDKS